ncbi:hypothetical protein [Alkaliphilus metalliredigens]|nr:hypothetical protein [Alkaliphilus metalliredigens]
MEVPSRSKVSTTPSHWVQAPPRGIPLGSSSKVSGMAETLYNNYT